MAISDAGQLLYELGTLCRQGLILPFERRILKHVVFLHCDVLHAHLRARPLSVPAQAREMQAVASQWLASAFETQCKASKDQLQQFSQCLLRLRNDEAPGNCKGSLARAAALLATGGPSYDRVANSLIPSDRARLQAFQTRLVDLGVLFHLEAAAGSGVWGAEVDAGMASGVGAGFDSDSDAGSVADRRKKDRPVVDVEALNDADGGLPSAGGFLESAGIAIEGEDEQARGGQQQPGQGEEEGGEKNWRGQGTPTRGSSAGAVPPPGLPNAGMSSPQGTALRMRRLRQQRQQRQEKEAAAAGRLKTPGSGTGSPAGSGAPPRVRTPGSGSRAAASQAGSPADEEPGSPIRSRRPIGGAAGSAQHPSGAHAAGGFAPPGMPSDEMAVLRGLQEAGSQAPLRPATPDVRGAARARARAAAEGAPGRTGEVAAGRAPAGGEAPLETDGGALPAESLAQAFSTHSLAGPSMLPSTPRAESRAHAQAGPSIEEGESTPPGLRIRAARPGPGAGPAAARVSQAAGTDGLPVYRLPAAYMCTEVKLPKKRPGYLSGYNMFVREQSATIRESSPELTQTEIMRKAGAAWKALSEADKEPYQAQAKADRPRIDALRAKWDEANGK